MDYIVAVPSYRRPDLFGKKTLRFLRASGAPNPIVYVADDQDLVSYRNLYPDLDIRLGVKGLCAVRDFIQNEQPLGKKIVFLDDDIEDLYCLDFGSEKPKKHKIRNFPEFVKLAFSCAEAAGTTMWGVYPTDHTLGLKPQIRRNLCYCVGACYGVVNSRLSVSLEYAEDFERSVRYWVKEGRLCRLEFIGVSTRYYKNDGGLQENRNELLNTECKNRLADEFPTLCKVVRKRGKSEIVFRRFPANWLDVPIQTDV